MKSKKSKTQGRTP